MMSLRLVHAAGLVLLLAGCSSAPRVQQAESPCAAGEATWACQIQRYHDISVQ